MQKTGYILKNSPGCLSSLRNTKLRSVSSKSNTSCEISIPKRIPRGPTDILRALESTIKRDPTAAHYKYHDDPYLIPVSNLSKRTFSLAQESGRKAAHWVRDQHPNLFQHTDCVPPINAFFPKMVYNDKSDVSVQDLQTAIANVLVSDAITVYKLLKAKNIDVDTNVLQSFLELLCFANHEDVLKDDFIEERWYMQEAGKKRIQKTWKDGELAEEVFNSQPEPSAEAYSALIQGMSKYHQVERAWQLFQEAESKGLVLNVEAYNSVIKIAGYLKEAYDQRWDFVKEQLTAMNTAKIAPNLGTLNAAMEVISTMSSNRETRENALMTIREFKALGIEPSLATWNLLVHTFCKERGPTSFILKDILPHIENKPHQIRDINDTHFFSSAMDVCRNHLRNRQLAERVNKLLHVGNNYDLIGNAYKESMYYKNYFLILMDTMPLDEFMSTIYEDLVPHVYIPEPSVMLQILHNVTLYGATQFLPQLWSDMLIFDHTDRENLLTTLLNIMLENKPAPDTHLLQQFLTIAWGVWTKISSQDENRIQKLSFTGEMLGQIMTIALWNRDMEKANAVMGKLDSDISHVLGVPKIDALSLFIDACIEEKLASNAIKCLQYCADNGFPEAEQFARKLNTELTLDGDELAVIGKIVGEHVLGKNTESK